MAHLVTGLINNSSNADNVVNELKKKGFAEDTSIITKVWANTQVAESGTTGSMVGALSGGIAGILFGASSLVVPGIGALLGTDPFALLMGAAGALAGGLIGFLIDAGVS